MSIKDRSYICFECSAYPKEQGLVLLGSLLARNAITASLGSVSRQAFMLKCVMICLVLQCTVGESLFVIPPSVCPFPLRRKRFESIFYQAVIFIIGQKKPFGGKAII